MTEIVFKTPVTHLTLNGFEIPKIVNPRNSGEYVALSLVEEGDEKTYLGIILGDMNLGVLVDQAPDSDKAELRKMMGNPAIFVPSLKQIIYGVECWWRLISSEEQLSTISDEELDKWGRQAREQIVKFAPIVAKYREEDAARAAENAKSDKPVDTEKSQLDWFDPS
jgi:hypothetical protein